MTGVVQKTILLILDEAEPLELSHIASKASQQCGRTIEEGEVLGVLAMLKRQELVTHSLNFGEHEYALTSSGKREKAQCHTQVA